MSLWSRHKRHALAGKLVLLFIVSGVIIVSVVGLSISHGFHEHFRETLQPHLVRYLEYVQQDIGMPPDRERARVLAEQLNLEIQIVDAQGVWSSRGTQVDLATLHIQRRFQQNGIDYELADDRSRHYLIGHKGDVKLVFSLRRSREEGGGWRAVYPLSILLLLLAVLFHLTRRLFKPIDIIDAGVKRFATGDLGHRINVCRRDELGGLAASFNAMADDIQRMLDAKRQLLLAVSHELRTPLTRAKVAVDLLEDDKRRVQIQEDLNEIDTLIGELLEIERLATRHQALHKTPCDLGALIADVVNGAYRGKVNIDDLPHPGPVLDVDMARVKLLLRNLLENSLRFTPERAPAPTVHLESFDGYVALVVQDFGVGIASEHLAHVMEPFYRADAARQRETGGYGLGLYLCRMIAEAHQGRLEITSTPGQGTTIKAYFLKRETSRM